MKAKLMNPTTVLRNALQMSEYVSLQYVADLNDEELMIRPHPLCNHINFQIGHLIASEHSLMSQFDSKRMPPLPAGFLEKYSKDKGVSNDPSAFESKESLMQNHRQQRDATLAWLDSISAEQLSDATGIPYAPTLAELFSMHAMHWLMHCGQWVIVRRELGKPVVI